MTIRAFCAREQLAETAFHAWRRTLRERDAQRRQDRPAAADSIRVSAAASAFVPVWVSNDLHGPAALVDITIELRGGRALRLPASMPIERVAAIARAIETADVGDDRGAA